MQGFDFREYAEKGFLFTPHQYIGEYESRGIITITIYPETKVTKGPTPKGWVMKKIGGPSGQDTPRYYLEEVIDQSIVIGGAYQAALDIGADAIMDFNIESMAAVLRGGIYQSGYIVSGFAIKRK